MYVKSIEWSYHLVNSCTLLTAIVPLGHWWCHSNDGCTISMVIVPLEQLVCYYHQAIQCASKLTSGNQTQTPLVSKLSHQSILFHYIYLVVLIFLFFSLLQGVTCYLLKTSNPFSSCCLILSPTSISLSTFCLSHTYFIAICTWARSKTQPRVPSLDDVDQSTTLWVARFYQTTVARPETGLGIYLMSFWNSIDVVGWKYYFDWVEFEGFASSFGVCLVKFKLNKFS